MLDTIDQIIMWAGAWLLLVPIACALMVWQWLLNVLAGRPPK